MRHRPGTASAAKSASVAVADHDNSGSDSAKAMRAAVAARDKKRISFDLAAEDEDVEFLSSEAS